MFIIIILSIHLHRCVNQRKKIIFRKVHTCTEMCTCGKCTCGKCTCNKCTCGKCTSACAQKCMIIENIVFIHKLFLPPQEKFSPIVKNA